MTATGGITATGGATATGGTTATGCKYAGTGGSVVTPPSNDFESNSTGWAMLSGRAVSRVTGSSNACVGAAYLLGAGSNRAGEWDGPAIGVLTYLVSGHTYKVTIAARFDPQNAPSAAKPLIFSAAVSCTSTSVSAGYSHLQQTDTLTTWTRFSGTLPTTLTNCTSISKVQAYVETNTAEAAFSINVDDFQWIDVT